MYLGLDIDQKLVEMADEAEKELAPVFKKYEQTSLAIMAKVIKAFGDCRLASPDFAEVTGYGYYDGGRDKLEQVYAQLFGAEDALVRPQIMSGTHALALAFFGLLRPGDTMVSISGRPYDSLTTMIGISGKSKNSLIAHGVNYEQIDLVDDDFDIAAIVNRIKRGGVSLMAIQRSRGYACRKSLTIEKIEKVIKAIKAADPNVIVLVDNCYGDFVEDREPTHVGADIIVGSLMKNLSGGITRTGGYIVGKKDLVWQVSERFSAPGIGKDLGANLNTNREMFMGLYYAPSAVESSLKTMTLASFLLQKLGYDVSPTPLEERTDIIQTIRLGSADALVGFCQGMQKGMIIENFVVPEAAPMPGYPDEEVMASGSFITGSTIDLSCDGPLTEPYICYMQGGITYSQGKLGILVALTNLLRSNGKK